MVSSLLNQKMIAEYIELNPNINKVGSIYDNIMVRSPLRFPGSKFQAIKFIKPIWESVEHDEFREPFFGGGAVFFAKPKVKHNWVNDLSKDLVLTFKIMANSLGILANFL
jgi:site-specific DNA-adenine methylase